MCGRRYIIAQPPGWLRWGRSTDADGDHWKSWWPAIREELLGKQTKDGYWQGQAGNEYGTAMALIILQVPNRLLPIFQR